MLSLWAKQNHAFYFYFRVYGNFKKVKNYDVWVSVTVILDLDRIWNSLQKAKNRIVKKSEFVILMLGFYKYWFFKQNETLYLNGHQTTEN